MWPGRSSYPVKLIQLGKYFIFKNDINSGLSNCNRLFFRKDAILTSISKNQIILNIARRKNISYKSGSVKTWRKTTTLMSLLYICVLLGLVLRSFNIFIIDVDVESNTGPTSVIEKAIRGSCHLGDRQFGDTAGVQCACNSLYILCWSQIRKLDFWDRLDLDHTLTESDTLTLKTWRRWAHLTCF